MHLPPQGAMVIWEWEMSKEPEDDSEIDHISETSSEGLAGLNPEIESCDSDAGRSTDPATVHTITFKCIGTTHNMNPDTTKSQYTA